MGEFADVDAVSLAQFGRKVYRFLACTENMLPANGTVLYPHFHSYMTDHQDDPYYADALKRVGDKGVYLRKRLLCYVISLSFLWEWCLTPCQQMNYGVSSVRFDFAKIIRLRTWAFFGIPGRKTSTEIVSIIFWLSFLCFDTVTACSLWMVDGREPFSRTKLGFWGIMLCYRVMQYPHNISRIV